MTPNNNVNPIDTLEYMPSHDGAIALNTTIYTTLTKFGVKYLIFNVYTDTDGKKYLCSGCPSVHPSHA